MSTKPLHQSTTIPGLVMWPNGAIVRVRVLDDAVIAKEYGGSEQPTAGTVVRDRNGRPDVITSYGRVDLSGLETNDGYAGRPAKKTLNEKAFELVEEYERRKRTHLMHDVTQAISLVVVRAAKKRVKGGYRDPA